MKHKDYDKTFLPSRCHCCHPHKTMGEVVQNTMRHTRPVVIPRLCGMKQQSIPTPSRLDASYLSKVLVLWNWSYFSFKAGSHVWCNSKHKKKNVWTRMTQAWACLRLMLVSYMTLPPSTCGLRDLQDYMCKAHLKTKKLVWQKTKQFTRKHSSLTEVHILFIL